uniref:Integrase catalytic domain-containing protein n=1 Tax=Tanacetum cinerariifolium TaxID=118510 RepID=A0A699KKY8_TANCI|nr:hypothetical protein [Tanacetum cinerariifolium]
MTLKHEVLYKHHRASCKSKTVSSVEQPLFRLHMDLFGPTFIKSLSKKSYSLVITDDYNRFSWVFFLASKDETPSVLNTFIIGLENLLSLKVKIIRCDNGIEFKIFDLNQFCGLKGIKREFSVPRTPQQNGIAERKNKTLIEAARTLLADSLISIPFWVEAVNTACYVQNKVLVTKPLNKTPYELLHGKFQGKVDEGFLVGYSVCSKASRVFNKRTHVVQETLHTMNYHLVITENKADSNAGFQDTEKAGEKGTQTYVLFPVLFDENKADSNAGFQDTEKTGEKGTQTYVLFPVLFDGSTNSQNNNKDALVDEKEHDDDIQKSVSPDIHSSSSGAQTRKQGDRTENKDKVNVASSLVSTAGKNSINSTNDFSAAGPSNAAMLNLEDLSHDADDTKSMERVVRDQGGISQMFNEDFHTCMFACFLLQEEPKRVHQALKDLSWIEAMQEELL